MQHRDNSLPPHDRKLSEDEEGRREGGGAALGCLLEAKLSRAVPVKPRRLWIFALAPDI